MCETILGSTFGRDKKFLKSPERPDWLCCLPASCSLADGVPSSPEVKQPGF